MDKTIRKNETCNISQTRCDFVFSSTRSCFIAYSFNESALEVGILRSLLESRGFKVLEAGGSITPGQYAFCTKICSSIIVSQFCVALINSDTVAGKEVPNANVNMEYGLMLGFNKHVIPFQRKADTLPFNVAGLDTIKYDNQDFQRLAAQAIDQAIELTKQDDLQPTDPNQIISVFLLSKKALFTPINTEGEQNIFQLGSPLGFYLLNSFSGIEYMYFGNFTAFRPDVVLWRLEMLQDILEGRRSSLADRVELGIVSDVQMDLFKEFFKNLQIWVLLTSEEDKLSVQQSLEKAPIGFTTQIFSLEDVQTELGNLPR